ncbi:uncharacterized protein LOC127453059 [Myxocyprinus asiaticus]|uniref:uncharacterized protein LOC127453059 n=1 Tax=Myxocyprinus asiaticus TaxID=70543 RepID=UPI0022227297|nr:uncharacterized protein LOC127453059 [Myxocyprinus asiaticus]
MGADDDAEAFLDLFERTAEIWGWPRDQWAARLLPLLSGEAQLVAQQLPATNLLAYDDLKKSNLQRVGRSPEEYRQLFRTLKLGKTDRPFAFSQRLQDACRKWLLAGNRDVAGVVDQVVLEQLIHRLSRGTAEWVQCHRPASLEEAVGLAENHLVVYQRAEEPSHSLSPSPMFSPISSPSPSLSHSALSPEPVPAPRRQGVLPPKPVPRARGFPSSATVPRRSPPQVEVPSELRGSWTLPGSVPCQGAGNGGPDPRHSADCPRSGWSISYTAPNVTVTVTLTGSTVEHQLRGLQRSSLYIVKITSQVNRLQSHAVSTTFTTGSGVKLQVVTPYEVSFHSAVISWKAPHVAFKSYRLTYHFREEVKEVILSPYVTQFELTGLEVFSNNSVKIDGERDGQYISFVSAEFPTASLPYPYPTDCSEVQMNGMKDSGEAEIYPEGKDGEPVWVYCDMETDGGGWTVGNKSVNC